MMNLQSSYLHQEYLCISNYQQKRRNYHFGLDWKRGKTRKVRPRPKSEQEQADDRKKCVRYVHDINTDRGLINVLHRETKKDCDCMATKKEEANTMDRMFRCEGCHKEFSKKRLKKCSRCNMHYCSKKCSHADWSHHNFCCKKQHQQLLLAVGGVSNGGNNSNTDDGK